MIQQRKVIHIDMDAFYASVEQRDFPEYKGLPLIVGGQPNSRGVVAACSYEARKFGVRSAMSAAKAKRLCPNAIFVKPRFQIYQQVSKQIHSIFREFTEVIEPLSLDEAYLDVTANSGDERSATYIAQQIRSMIVKRIGLTASAGISYNKFLAKLASEVNKPNGYYVIPPERGPIYVAQLPVGKFFGVGKVTEAKMHALKIYTGADLKAQRKTTLIQHFGKVGAHYYSIARGIDQRPVNAFRERKSIGKEVTFAEDIGNIHVMLQNLAQLAEQVSTTLQNKQLYAKTITIKVKYADFKQVTRSITLENAFQGLLQQEEVIAQLLQKTDAGVRKVRLLGVSVSQLQADSSLLKETTQYSLF